MWFIGVEVEQETSAPPPKKILDPPLEGKPDLVVDQDQQDASMIRCSTFPGGSTP